MHFHTPLMMCVVLGVTLYMPLASAQITAEEISTETMPEPGTNWFVSNQFYKFLVSSFGFTNSILSSSIPFHFFKVIGIYL
jgi:hypothetical protein